VDSKPDKEWVKRDDISLLSEIIANFEYWQEIFTCRNYKNGSGSASNQPSY
jgi:hypothetical protein